jgi:hypothetical protein
VQIDVMALVPWFTLLLSAFAVWNSFASNRSKVIDEKLEKSDQKIEKFEKATDARYESLKTWIEGKASKDHVGVLDEKVDIVEGKVAVLENDMKHLPDKETTHRLELSIGEMRSEMRGLTEKMKPIAAMADRVQEAVMEKVMS